MVDARTEQTYLMAEERLFGPTSVSRAMRTAGFVVEELRVSGFAPPFIARTSPAPLARRVDDFFRRVPGIRNFGAIYTLVGRKIG